MWAGEKKKKKKRMESAANGHQRSSAADMIFAWGGLDQLPVWRWLFTLVCALIFIVFWCTVYTSLACRLLLALRCCLQRCLTQWQHPFFLYCPILSPYFLSQRFSPSSSPDNNFSLVEVWHNTSGHPQKLWSWDALNSYIELTPSVGEAMWNSPRIVSNCWRIGSRV